MKVLSFGPGQRSRDHANEACRDHTALVTSYGKEMVQYVGLFSGEFLHLKVVSSHRTEFDQWFVADPKTSPKRIAEVYHQYARRLGATTEAIEVLRQFVTITEDEEKTMVAKAQASTATKPTFGAAPDKPEKAAVKPAAKTEEAKPMKPAAAAKPAAATKPAKEAPAKKEDAAPKAPQTVTFKKLPKDVKLPPQERRILEVLKESGPSMTTEDLYKALDGELPTKQPVAKVFKFYQKHMVDEGFITIK